MPNVPRQLVEEPLSGFPELGPAAAIATSRVVQTIRRHYEQAGYAPLESPLVERPEILAAKAGGQIKSQMYGLRLLNVPGSGDDTVGLGLRFDHTVQLARYVAAKYASGELRFPFRRQAIGPVFRGERPKDGRSRQFTQADIDAIGDGSLSFLHDAEMVDVIVRIFGDLAVGPFKVRINNRKILEGVLRSSGCDTDEKVNAARAAIDDVDKVGFDVTIDILAGIGIEQSSARGLLKFLKSKTPIQETMSMLKAKNFDSGFQDGVAELEIVVNAVRQLGVPEDRFVVDPSLARGLDYYTSTVFEAHLDAHPDLSIAGGGRYDNLAEQYTDRHLPGVGISIGVTRLVSRLIREKLINADATTVAPVLVTRLDPNRYSAEYFAQATELRAAGIGVETYLNEDKIGRQLQFAAKRGFTIAIIAGADELEHIEQGQPVPMVTIRNLKRGEEQRVPRSALVETVRAML
jgi:histidyl-tRNA synthetase